jgi:hypothetical protein
MDTTVLGEFLCRKHPQEGREIVSKLRQKIPLLKLSLAEYQVLRNQVLKRDVALPTLRHIERFARSPREITGQSRG